MGIVEIRFDQSIIDLAEARAKALGKLNDSITEGEGNVCGYIGQTIAARIFGAKDVDLYDYDLILPNGKTVYVKSKRTTFTPRDNYDVSVCAETRPQECDFYCFMRVHIEIMKAWLLGYYLREKYLREAVLKVKGEYDPSNGFTVKKSCYNMKIGDLRKWNNLKSSYQISSRSLTS